MAFGSSGSRLPDIPLTTYNRELAGWLVFLERFVVLVVQHSKLTNSEHFFYLTGCLRSDALHAIQNIPISETTYELAWSMLVDRFDKPRLL